MKTTFCLAVTVCALFGCSLPLNAVPPEAAAKPAAPTQIAIDRWLLLRRCRYSTTTPAAASNWMTCSRPRTSTGSRPIPSRVWPS